jgi:hypothetical protein
MTKREKTCVSPAEAWDLNSLMDLRGYRCPAMHYALFYHNLIYPFLTHIYPISGKTKFHLLPESNLGGSFLSHSLD